MQHGDHWRACWWLFVATIVWGLSFPLIKTLWMLQHQLVPEGSTVFFAALAVSVRFGAAAVVLLIFSWRSLAGISKSELSEGLGLSLFGGCGIVFQMDGLAYTSASVSAFLTQFYCLLIPMWAAWRQKIVPRVAVVLASIMVLAGVAILAGMRLSELHIGRGEAETLVAATFFAMQILWLERPCYASNRVMPFTIVMFAGTACLLLPLALLAAPYPAALVRAYASPSVWLVMGGIVGFCTLGAYLLMNRWQRLVTATEAGLIYCIEPLAASAFALFLPGLLSVAVGVGYANETVTWRLLVGGGLITAANVLVQLETVHRGRRDKAALAATG